MKTLIWLSFPLLLSACTLAPNYEPPAVPVTFPQSATPVEAAKVSWRALFIDPRLQGTIDLALSNNRDLRIAALNVDRSRAQHGIARSGLLPNINASVSQTQGTTINEEGEDEYSRRYSANLGLASYEVDLFGRIRNLKEAALQDFFAARENRRGVEISLIASVASAWLTVAADQDSLRLTEQTSATRAETYEITLGRARIGAVSDIEVQQTRQQMEQARADVESARTRLDQSTAALTLLVGATIPVDLMPDGLSDTMVADALPADLPSEILLERPDVMAAEHNLRASNADIGVARAAFLPRLSLTAAFGWASPQFDSLFDNRTWSFSPNLSVPLFNAGAVGGLGVATANRDIAVAQYERAIQSAFADLYSVLAVRRRIEARLEAQTAATDAARRAESLSQARYQAGSVAYLGLLDAQRTRYASEQGLINLRLSRALNLTSLYRSIGADPDIR